MGVGVGTGAPNPEGVGAGADGDKDTLTGKTGMENLETASDARTQSFKFFTL